MGRGVRVSLEVGLAEADGEEGEWGEELWGELVCAKGCVEGRTERKAENECGERALRRVVKSWIREMGSRRPTRARFASCERG